MYGYVKQLGHNHAYQNNLMHIQMHVYSSEDKLLFCERVKRGR